jgi:flavin-dependent dehydrogenase
LFKVDILIAGAGPAGCAVALEALARGYSVAMSEAPRARAPVHLGEIARPGEFTAGDEYSVESESFVLWSGPGIGVAWSNPAAQIDKHAFNENLRRQAIHAGANYLPETRVRSLERTGGRWRIDTTSGPIDSAWIADATGRVAAIARKLGARRVAFDRLTATTVTFPPSGRPTQHLVEAAENGWWFCAHHPALGTVGTYFTDNDLRTDFDDALRQSRCAKVFLPADGAGRPNILAAGTAMLDPVAGEGWFAVGDAAWSCDPLSSSGISNAFRSASWALEGMEDYADRVAEEFAAYMQSYQSVYRSAGRTGEFWRRRETIFSLRLRAFA